MIGVVGSYVKLTEIRLWSDRHVGVDVTFCMILSLLTRIRSRTLLFRVGDFTTWVSRLSFMKSISILADVARSAPWVGSTEIVSHSMFGRLKSPVIMRSL